MRFQFTSRRAASALAGALIATSLLAANAAHSTPKTARQEALLSLLVKTAGARVAPSVTLPTPTGPGKPFRQTMVGDCSVEVPSPTLGDITLCRFPPVRVGAQRMLEIENVSCLILPPGGLILLATSGNADKVFTSIVGAGFLEGSFTLGGPFYVAPGEKIFIWGLAATPDDATGSCTVYGKLSPAG